jgi:predicted phage baseplate assembly protein
MPNTLDPSIRGLNDCDGCEGIAPETPVKVENRPGLDHIAQRVGTHARFLQSMLARLSSAQYPALHALNTRERDDLTIALLDACAAVDDGLTFYTERYANEWYVRTATERVSLVQLARLIGYEPRPGVAANTYLAFTIEDTPGTPESTSIVAGTRVMSIPGKDELPQFFETSATITARSAWNAMRARTRAPQEVTTTMTLAVIQGIESGIRRGDSVLIVVSDSETAVKRVQRVVQDPAAGVTRLELGNAPSPSAFPGGLLAGSLQLTYALLNDTTFDNVFTGQIYTSSDVAVLGQLLSWSSIDFMVAANVPPPPPPAEKGVYALRTRAAIFGHNAPSWASLPQIVQGQDRQIIGRVLASGGSPEPDTAKWQYPQDWDALDARARNNPEDLSEALSHTIDLDNVYPAITEDSWIALESPGTAAKAYRVAKNQELTRNDFTLSVKVTRLDLTSGTGLETYPMRQTTVYGQSDQLPLATVPLTANVQGDRVVLDKYYPGLVKGQLVVLSGERTDLNGVPGSEVRELADALADGTLEAGRLFTVLVFSQPLSYSYKPETVTINANVVAATHGETKAEVLGGGDGATRYQTFALKQAPLTYLSARTPSGAQSTLEVRVNDVRWDEVPTLYGRAPDERVYVIRHEDSGQTRVQFNAPLPNGQENVRATYRIGIGLAGMLRANQLSMLAVRPLGVRGVSNPLAPSGAEDREAIEDVRDNSPLTVLTLDRLVSLQDHQDFARAFAGFSKALATPTSDGARRGVFLTVAGETGQVSESSAEFANLVAMIKQSGDPFVDVTVKPYRPAFFQVEATIGVDPAYLADVVAGAVRAALAERFGFAARQFGQPVTAVEVIAAIQRVPGVVFVNLVYLFRSDPLNPMLLKTLQSVLPAAKPQPGVSRLDAQAAELLIIDPRPIQITTVSA